MKNKYILSAALLLGTTSMLAQETYENTKLVENELNGTARYVGMGGALDALGADISVIRSNPAGLGLFTKSRADVSFGFVSQQDAKAFKNGSVTTPSFDQAGFVYVMRDRNGEGSGFNFAVNYHKSRNFDYILSAAGGLKNASQNTLSFLKAIGKDDEHGISTFNVEQTKHGLRGTQPYTSQLDNLYYNTFIMDANMLPGYNSATGYVMNRANTGYIGTYDFSISGSIGSRVFLGGTVGFHDVNYKGVSEYSENIVDAAGVSKGTLTVNDERKITGTGVDFKLGLLFLPVSNSPFRVGLSIASPTFYNLTTSNATYLSNAAGIEGVNKTWATSEAYAFKLITPWKFGVSLGHTVGNYLALGAGYEYADYGHMGTRVNEGGSYDWYYDAYYETTSSDVAMDNHTKKTLKGVSTFKVGAEFKPMPSLALRAGYNYLSPMYRSEGYKDGSIDSYGSNYASATDYVNWKATNRFTLGLGYSVSRFNIDLAYQYSGQDGDFYPFMNAYGSLKHPNTQTNAVEVQQIDNYADAVSVSHKRHQLLLTLGYRF